jgi:hypothetical protein
MAAEAIFGISLVAVVLFGCFALVVLLASLRVRVRPI